MCLDFRMGRALRFIVVLVLGLGVLATAAAVVVQKTTRDWFERDVVLRARLAVSSARQAIRERTRDDHRLALGELLDEMARDERIMGAAFCARDGERLARTNDYPETLTCAQLGARVASGEPWYGIAARADGNVHVSAIPLDPADMGAGFVVLVHDWSYVERREHLVRRSLFAGFAILAVLASLVTLIAARLSWRGWSEEVRRLLRGGPPTPARKEFAPILRDVRELVERLSAEKEIESEGGVWNAQRLKGVLERQLHGERVVIVANREPYIHERDADGTVRVQHPASGLVTALEPVMRACSGVWIAHGSGSADRETADRHGRVRVPPGEESYVVRRVWLSPEEERGYYYGFANEGLWPLCHIAHNRPQFRSTDFIHYERVNRKFADAVCAEVEGEDPIVLVQDYHFALAPKFIRERLPRATIITFWHVPWPNAERFGICPWHNELLEGLLGSSIVGFHTQLHCNNFLQAVDRFMEARIDRELNGVVHGGQATLVRPYPISVEWPPRWLDKLPSVAECRAEVLAELKLPAITLLGLGIDRLDYTKGIEERLLAVERLLEKFPSLRGRFVFVQLAAPSRSIIERYRALSESVEKLAVRINERFASGVYRPIIFRRAHHEPPSVFRYYRAADVCYVSSLHDGMNLVAKEFVSARDDERGVLVLSHFAGAARELAEALIVNPYDLDQAASALATAVQMSPEEQRDRMRFLRSFVAEFNVYRWAGRMLVDAARLRRRDRVAERWTESIVNAAG